MNLKHIFVFILFLISTSCSSPVIVQSHTEALSQSVYATKDSIDNQRVDLAHKYADITTTLIPPPKNRIVIEPIIKTQLNGDKKRTVIVPDSYKGRDVVVLGSAEWDILVEEADNAKAYKQDLENFQQATTKVTEELQKQLQLVATIQHTIDTLKLEKSKLETQIWKQRIVIFTLVLAIAGYIAAKIYKPELLGFL